MDNQHIVSKDTSPSPSSPSVLHRRPSDENRNRATKRPRASKPKVKSGCQTCKTRRIKCDETKPQCLRCQKLGRPCEGYATTPLPPRGPIQIQPRTLSPTLYRPSVSVQVGENEGHYFEVFVDHAAEELSGYFDSAFWSHIALQESHEVPAIRHAVIALGALNKSLSMAPDPSLKVNVIQTLEIHHHEQAVLHYHKAIQLLNQYISESRSPQLRTALIACILFVCFETIQGSFGSSIQQMYGGLKLLRSYYRGRIHPEGKSPSSTRDQSSNDAKMDMDEDQSDSAITAQIKDFFESDAWHEAPQLSSSSHRISQHEFTNRSSVSNRASSQPWKMDLTEPSNPMLDGAVATSQKDLVDYATQSSMLDPDPYDFQIGKTEFAELNYQSTRPSLSKSHSSDSYDPHQIAQSFQTGSLKRSLSQEQRQQLPTSSMKDLEIYSMKGRTMSTFSLNDTSSAYSSDSGSYREPSPHPHQSHNNNANTTAFQRSSFSHLSQNTPSHPQPTSRKSLTSHTQLQSQPLLQRTLELEDPILQTFVRFTNTGLFFTMAPAIPILHWDIHQLFHTTAPPLFSNLESAQHHWDFLMDRCLAFYSTTLLNRANKPQKLPSIAELTRQHTNLISSITQFERALQPLLETADSLPTASSISAHVITLYTHATLILLSQTTRPSEMTYDSFLPSFRHIVHTSQKILALPPAKPTQTRFSFSIGIIPPLHLTAMKCRDPRVRRQAVELLLKSAWQEGLWDSILCGRIGRWLIGCEEDGLVPFDEVSGSSGETRNAFDQPESEGNEVRAKDRKSTGTSSKPKSTPQNTKMILPQRIRKSSSHTSTSQGRKSSTLSSISASNSTSNTNLALGKAPETEVRDWCVPEANRAQLISVSFHTPDRYIKFKCKKMGEEGEVRETVIAW